MIIIDIINPPYHCTKNEVSIKNFFCKFDQIHRKLRIWSYLLKKSLMESFIFCAVYFVLSSQFFDKYMERKPLGGWGFQTVANNCRTFKTFHKYIFSG